MYITVEFNHPTVLETTAVIDEKSWVAMNDDLSGVLGTIQCIIGMRYYDRKPKNVSTSDFFKAFAVQGVKWHIEER